jgi:hypothetical protein
MTILRNSWHYISFEGRSTRTKIIACILAIALGIAIVHAWNHYDGPTHHGPPASPSEFDNGMIKFVSIHFPAQTEQNIAQLASVPIGGVLGPAGWYNHCSPKWYGIVPYLNCGLLLQPATTLWTNNEFNGLGSRAPDVAATVMGAICAITKLPLLVLVCTIAGELFGQAIVDAFKTAAANEQCVRILYNTFPWAPIAPAPPVPYHVDNYGYWETWRIAWINGVDFRYWGYPTSCRMPRDCVLANAGDPSGCII